MREYQLFSDSACDLPESLRKEFRIELIPFYVSFDQETYYKENLEITQESFYETLSKKNVFARTSLPSVQDYIQAFRPFLKEGKDVICLCLTQKLSGSYKSAMNAKQILEEQFPNAEIYIIDSIQATAAQGMLLLQMAQLQRARLTASELVAATDRLKTTARIMFTVDTLDYLTQGRRIGKVNALAKDMLDLKPLIQLKEAELIPYSNIRGRKNSLDKLVEMVGEYFKEQNENPADYAFGIVNATTLPDAQYLQKQVEQFIGHNLVYPIFRIGVTIGTYTGPGAIGVCFVKKHDKL